MTNQTQIFKNQEFGAIRTISDEQGEPMFCAKDVCDALGYNNSRDALRKHVEPDDVAKRDTIDALGRNHKGDGTKHTTPTMTVRNILDIFKRVLSGGGYQSTGISIQLRRQPTFKILRGDVAVKFPDAPHVERSIFQIPHTSLCACH